MEQAIREIIKNVLGGADGFEVFVPEEEQFGHYATNAALRLAQKEKKNPLAFAKELAEKIFSGAPEGFFASVEAAPPGFINMRLAPRTLQDAFGEVLKQGKRYGRGNIGKGRTVIVEYSQPNIAKRLHVGHLRTTIIGDALANMHAFLGYRVIRWNYLGDWGTQFGKVIAAYKLWGEKAPLKKNPIEALANLYVRFHEEEKNNAELASRGQEEFRKLEEGDGENRRLWQWFRKESIRELKGLYRTLGVDFDIWIGESFFEKEMRPLVAELLKSGAASESEGSVIIRIEGKELPALIQKSDGASLYLTRDIANLRYRIKKYKPEKILYVVGNEQSLHFEQLFAVAKILGIGAPELVHVKYGLVLGEDAKKLATREGRAILLKDVLEKATKLARDIVEQKNPEFSNKEKGRIAEIVGIGALKYNDLRENRLSDIVFDWRRMLDFSGDSAPYLQYTFVRLTSIVRKAGRNVRFDASALAEPNDLALIGKLLLFPRAVEKAAEARLTNGLALYLFELAGLANRFYETTPILKDENTPRKHARVVLMRTTAGVLSEGLGLLGIRTAKRM